MWKLLPVCFLAGCTAMDSSLPNSDQDQQNPGQVIRQIDLPLGPAAQTAGGQPSQRAYQGSRIRGWLEGTGAWHIRAEVQHGRFLCGTYQTGIQLGSGTPACSSVQWLTDIEYASRLMHCNNASRLHVGGGRFANTTNRFEEVTCVRVVIRCEGTC